MSTPVASSPEPEASVKVPVKGWRRSVVIAVDRAILSLARHWALVGFTLALLYSGLPFVAPIAMKMGWTPVADVIYTAYAPLCHQFAFRSWFLFGEQSAYPRAVAGLGGGTFEQYASQDPAFSNTDLTTLNAKLMVEAKEFRGNEQMGYKVAYCERDVAIYGSIGLFALLYGFYRRRGSQIPYMSFWLYLVVAIAPIGLDGFSQLFANMNIPFLAFLAGRESTPFLRVLTGSLFGLGNAWLSFPYLDEGFADIRVQLESKLTKAGVLAQKV
jgi:uncharacterized membrane protein